MADMLATPTELASYVQSDLDTASATLALEMATGWIQREVGHRVLEVSNDTVVLDGGDRTIYLPGRPVTSVGTVTTTDAYGTVESPVLGVDYRVRDYRLVRSGWRCMWPEMVTVVYTHGYGAGAVPQVVRGVCLAAASRVYANPDGVKQEVVGGMSVTYNTPLYNTGMYLTEQERSDLAAYRSALAA